MSLFNQMKEELDKTYGNQQNANTNIVHQRTFYCDTVLAQPAPKSFSCVKGEPSFYDDITTPHNNITYGPNIIITNKTSPKEIHDHIRKNVIGLSKYRGDISNLIWKITHGYDPTTATLIVGNPSCGKKKVFESLLNVYPCIKLVDGTTLTSTECNMMHSINQKLRFLAQERKSCEIPVPPIMVIDNFDEMLRNHTEEGTMILNELFYVLNHEPIKALDKANREVTVNTKNMIIILIASMTDDKDDLMRQFVSQEKLADEGCIINELQKKLTKIMYVDGLDKTELETILVDERFSPISRLNKELNIEIVLDNSPMQKIINDAYTNKTGVWGMTLDILNRISTQLLNASDKEIIKITDEKE